MNYSQLYLDDLKKIQEAIPNLEKLTGTSVLITGAGGMICSAMVDFLLALNESQQMGIQVYAAARNEQKVRKRFSRYADNENFHYVQYSNPFGKSVPTALQYGGYYYCRTVSG